MFIGIMRDNEKFMEEMKENIFILVDTLKKWINEDHRKWELGVGFLVDIKENTQ
jgi:hypothetical protein